MEKILRNIFMVMALCCAFTACSDDDDDNAASVMNQNASAETAGVYSGTWTRTLNSVPTEAQGTLTLTASDDVYITNVTATCAELDINLSSTANILGVNNEYTFYNTYKDNGFAAETGFTGTVSSANEATISFRKVVREGRRTYTYDYTFKGTKQ